MTPTEKPQRRRITLSQAEVEHIPREQDRERVKKYPQLTLPFGFLNDEWEALKAQMHPGDELWECCSDKKSWDSLMGLHWVELTRNGKRVASITVRLN